MVVVASMISTSSFAYNCFDSEVYKNQIAMIRVVNKDNGEKVGVAVSFLRKSCGILFDEALRDVIAYDAGPDGMAYDEKLREIAKKLKA